MINEIKIKSLEEIADLNKKLLNGLGKNNLMVVVDDDQMVLNVTVRCIARTLEPNSEDFTLAYFNQSDLCYNFLDLSPKSPFMVLTDLDMPGKNGMDIAEITKERDNKTYCALQTGSDYELKSGDHIDEVMFKPCVLGNYTDLLERAFVFRNNNKYL